LIRNNCLEVKGNVSFGYYFTINVDFQACRIDDRQAILLKVSLEFTIHHASLDINYIPNKTQNDLLDT